MLKRLVLLFGLALLTVSGTVWAAAQPRSGRIALGAETGSGALGATVGYALSDQIQLGSGFGAGFYASSGSTVGMFSIAPYARLLLNPSKSFSPLLQAQLTLAGGDALDVFAAGMNLNISAGMAYFVSNDFTVSARVNLASLYLSDGYSLYGLGALDARLQAEWWF